MRCVCALIFVTILLIAADLGGVESKKMESIEEIRKAVKSLRKTCQQKIGASKEVLDGAVNGEFPPDPKLQCYLRCVMTLTKAMKNDKMQVEFLRKQADLMLPPKLVGRFHDVISKCEEKVDGTEPDGCVLAWNAAKCMYESDSEVIFKVLAPIFTTREANLAATIIHKIAPSLSLVHEIINNHPYATDAHESHVLSLLALLHTLIFASPNLLIVPKSSDHQYPKNHRHYQGNPRRRRASLNEICKNSRTKRQCRRV